MSTIRLAEDREAFKQLLVDISKPVLPSIRQVLVERSLWGWKEIEYEVMRDAADTCITVCSMPNVDPMRVHTGDSIVVAPAQTLSDRRPPESALLDAVHRPSAEHGGRLRRTVCAGPRQLLLLLGDRGSTPGSTGRRRWPPKRPDTRSPGWQPGRGGAEAGRDPPRDHRSTFAALEPALDYVVVKVPRWPFDKFPGADGRLGTQMKSTGRVMAMERTFEGALAKALRSLEQRTPAEIELDDPALIDESNDGRLFAL